MLTARAFWREACPSYAQCSIWKRKREVHVYGNLKHLSSSPMNSLCVQAAELDSCEERRVCLVGALGRKGPLYPGQAGRWSPGGQGSQGLCSSSSRSQNPRGNEQVSQRGRQRTGGPTRCRERRSQGRKGQGIGVTFLKVVTLRLILQGPTQKASLLERLPQSPGRDSSSSLLPAWPSPAEPPADALSSPAHQCVLRTKEEAEWAS